MSANTQLPTAAERLLAALTTRTHENAIAWEEVWRGQSGYEALVFGQLVRVVTVSSPYSHELTSASVTVYADAHHDAHHPQLDANMYSPGALGGAVRELAAAVLAYEQRAAGLWRVANTAAVTALAAMLEEGE